MQRRIVVTIGTLVFGSAVVLIADTKIHLTINSNPPGALVYINEDGRFMGYTPVVVQYKAPNRFKKNDPCLPTTAVRVQWASGAHASTDSIRLCPSETRNQQVTFMRPDVDGLPVDLQFALQVQQLRLQQQANETAVWQAWQAAAQPASPKHCTSTVIGMQVFTSCY